MRRVGPSAVVVLLAGGMLGGCAGDDDAAAPESSTGNGLTVVAPTLAREPSASDYCGIVEELHERADEAGSLAQEQQVLAIGMNLDFVAASAERLHTLRDGHSARLWEEMASAYRDAADFFAVSGEQLANDDFLYLFAVAVTASDAAYTVESDYAQRTCGVDLMPLVVDNG